MTIFEQILAGVQQKFLGMEGELGYRIEFYWQTNSIIQN